MLSVAEATKALQHKGHRRRRHARRPLDELGVLVERTNEVIAQARVRVGGETTRRCDPAGVAA